MSLIHSSNKRPTPLKDADYDHEIVLVDHTQLGRAASTQEVDATARLSKTLTRSTTRRDTDGGPLHKSGSSLRQDWRRRKWTKNRGREEPSEEDERGTGSIDSQRETGNPSCSQHLEESAAGARDSPVQDDDRQRLRARSNSVPTQDDRGSAIDILFENQRGGFLCGMALFSSRALGNLDPAPWTNKAHKPSATNPSNAQVPDPQWRWAWKDWSIHKEGHVDEEGWQYSFAFSKKFSWHKGSWWNSFVRRRVWIRKRVKRESSLSNTKQAGVLSDTYFAIHPAHDGAMASIRSRTSSVEPGRNRYSVKELVQRDGGDEISTDEIHDMRSLMNVLRFLRIDREKMEAVESFIKHGRSQLAQLEGHMHDIMRSFVFQASRRLLLAHLIKILDQCSNDASETNSTDMQSQIDGLQKAIQAAEREVKGLEYWSDVRDMAVSGETTGAVDSTKGWDEDEWVGIDASGPEDLKRRSGVKDEQQDEEASSNSTQRKGKSKEEVV